MTVGSLSGLAPSLTKARHCRAPRIVPMLKE